MPVVNPKWQNPTAKGTEIFPNVIQAPASTQTKITGDPELAVALQDQYRTNIHNFIQSQRQAYSLSTMEQYRTKFVLPGLTVKYLNNQGKEYINFEVTVSAPNPQPIPELHTDIMLDGYICWVHIQGGEHQEGGGGYPFGLKINGEQVATNNGLNECVTVVGFGSDALHIWASPLTNPKNTQGVRTHQILPSRPTTSKDPLTDAHMHNFDYQTDFGLWLSTGFQTIEQFRYPFFWPIEPGAGNFQPHPLTGSNFTNIDNPPVIVEKPLISPLFNIRGKNLIETYTLSGDCPTYITIGNPVLIITDQLHHNHTFIADRGYVYGVQNLLFGYFFDRDPKKFRRVSQSWHYPSVGPDGLLNSGQGIAVNDGMVFYRKNHNGPVVDDSSSGPGSLPFEEGQFNYMYCDLTPGNQTPTNPDNNGVTANINYPLLVS